MVSFTRRMFNALKPRLAPSAGARSDGQPLRPPPPPPIRSRSPSPPPPPIVTPLLEMGFQLQHIQRALSATGMQSMSSYLAFLCLMPPLGSLLQFLICCHWLEFEHPDCQSGFFFFFFLRGVEGKPLHSISQTVAKHPQALPGIQPCLSKVWLAFSDVRYCIIFFILHAQHKFSLSQINNVCIACVWNSTDFVIKKLKVHTSVQNYVKGFIVEAFVELFFSIRNWCQLSRPV